MTLFNFQTIGGYSTLVLRTYDVISIASFCIARANKMNENGSKRTSNCQFWVFGHLMVLIIFLVIMKISKIYSGCNGICWSDCFPQSLWNSSRNFKAFSATYQYCKGNGNGRMVSTSSKIINLTNKWNVLRKVVHFEENHII